MGKSENISEETNISENGGGSKVGENEGRAVEVRRLVYSEAWR